MTRVRRSASRFARPDEAEARDGASVCRRVRRRSRRCRRAYSTAGAIDAVAGFCPGGRAPTCRSSTRPVPFSLGRPDPPRTRRAVSGGDQGRTDDTSGAEYVDDRSIPHTAHPARRCRSEWASCAGPRPRGQDRSRGAPGGRGCGPFPRGRRGSPASSSQSPASAGRMIPTSGHGRPTASTRISCGVASMAQSGRPASARPTGPGVEDQPRARRTGDLLGAIEDVVQGREPTLTRREATSRWVRS